MYIKKKPSKKHRAGKHVMIITRLKRSERSE